MSTTPPSADGSRAEAADDQAERFEDVAFDVFQKRCPSRSALEHVTAKWAVLVLGALAEGEGGARFGALRRRVEGVSEKMLSQTLQTLERDGFVERRVLRPIPPHVEYSLTPLGRDTARHLLGLVEFLEGRMDEVVAARTAHDRARGGDGTA
ncbi:winged helix-turn-helix transcriptional regulator [Nocardiopsis composta]|uniref:DNA-binding HxlR family transcriptional regulator n=1 Tax=Nocardiopsis composta TaxID=157465 RepID=A0A7W8VBE3_9ACTN|nr:helix-turn-helix domain-containing protein [Nocardiopsis composta]MBB5430256.1 DNA-binding HxlR family transcriptional regulator [Nocardiopsis composta]